MVTVPVSFQYKNIKTHGIVTDNGGRKGDLISKEEKSWNKAVSGLRAEQKIFDQIKRRFSDQPCLFMNGFREGDLIRVVKSKIRKNKIQLSDQVKLISTNYNLICSTKRKCSFTKQPTDILRK